MDLVLLYLGVLLLAAGATVFKYQHLRLCEISRDLLTQSYQAESASKAKVLLSEVLGHLRHIGLNSDTPGIAGEWYRTILEMHEKLGTEGTNFVVLKKIMMARLGMQHGSVWCPYEAAYYPHRLVLNGVAITAGAMICLSGFIAILPHLV